jgi:hypothetical protein
MRSQLSWNIAVKEILIDFADRMKSAIIHRIVISLNKGLVMGGNTPKIFKSAAIEVGQVNRLENQRKATMSIYTVVILVCFFVFLAIIIIMNLTIFKSFFDCRKWSTHGRVIHPSTAWNSNTRSTRSCSSKASEQASSPVS